MYKVDCVSTRSLHQHPNGDPLCWHRGSTLPIHTPPPPPSSTAQSKVPVADGMEHQDSSMGLVAAALNSQSRRQMGHFWSLPSVDSHLQHPKHSHHHVGNACSEGARSVLLRRHRCRQSSRHRMWTHLLMHCRWKAWLQQPQTTALSSPGNLASGGQPSKGALQIPQTSSPAQGLGHCFSLGSKGGHSQGPGLTWCFAGTNCNPLLQEIKGPFAF